MASLPTIEEIKIALGIDPADTSQDAAIERTLEAVIGMIEGHLGRGIAYAQQLQEFDPITSRDPTLFLFRFPVDVVASVLQDEQPMTAGAWRVFKSTGQLKRYYGFAACGCQDVSIAVDYTGGYPDDAWPADLLDAVMRVFYARWNATGNSGNVSNMVGSVSENRSVTVDGLTVERRDPPQTTYAYGGDILSINPEIAPVAAILDPYRSRRAPGV